MRVYNSFQQVQIFNGCKTATELITMHEYLEEIQVICFIAQMAYDLKMETFLIQDDI